MGKKEQFTKRKSICKMSLHLYRARQDPFEKFFSQAMQPFHVHSQSTDMTKHSPKMDLVENEKEYTLTCDVPGVEKENVDIKLDGKVLTVTVEKKEEKSGEDDKYHWQERFSGKTSRSIRLSDDVNFEGIKAKHESNGVLKVHIPKVDSEELGPTSIQIH